MRTRAVVLRGISTDRPYTRTRPVEVEELDLGAPREGEVLVRVAAASLCHSDLSVVNGDRVRPLPMALGHEAVGVVEETGPGVHRISPVTMSPWSSCRAAASAPTARRAAPPCARRPPRRTVPAPCCTAPPC